MSTQTIPTSAALQMPPSGSVLTVVQGDEMVLWLFGDIDLAVAEDLHQVAGHTPLGVRRLTVEASRMTFSDATLMTFLARAARMMPVRVRRPRRALVELLKVTQVGDLVSIDLGTDPPSIT